MMPGAYFRRRSANKTTASAPADARTTDSILKFPEGFGTGLVVTTLESLDSQVPSKERATKECALGVMFVTDA
jgi:hypothetical protein